jgi:hypothetical protein
VIVTTNLDLPCKIEVDDRRFVMFQCSSERKRDKAYFDGFARYMDDPRNLVAIAAHLRAEDLSGVDWIADRPQSDVYRDARYDCVDLVLRFLEALHLCGANYGKRRSTSRRCGVARVTAATPATVSCGRPSSAPGGAAAGGDDSLQVQGSLLFGSFIAWLAHTNHPAASWNVTNFGRHMGEYVKKSGGAVVKVTDAGNRALYCFERAGMERFLRANGMLIGRGFEWAVAE